MDIAGCLITILFATKKEKYKMIFDDYHDSEWTAKAHAKISTKRIGSIVPSASFKIRVRDESVEGPNPFRWDEMTTFDIFASKRVIVFSLPGAFTPTCSTYQLPNFEKMYREFKTMGIDAIYCLSVNDAFTMNAWGKSQGIKKIKLIPDGNGDFTSSMRMLVRKNNLGFGERSWRYAMIVNNGRIEAWFEEPGFSDNCETDPYGESSPENIMTYLQSKQVDKERGK
jgi:peroxiredoxin